MIVFYQTLLFGASLFLGHQLYQIINEKNQFTKNYENQMKEKLKFADIYGLDQAKQQLNEIIEYLKEPKKYQAVGARLRKGVLIFGPPGTGKTMLAKATAGESKCSFLYANASEFIEIYVGVGAKRIRDLFL